MESGSQPPLPPPPSEQPEKSPPPADPAGVAPPAPPVPLDADDTRGLHFRRLSSNPVTLGLGSVLVIGAFVGGTLGVGIAVGAGGAAVAILLVLLIVFVLASGAAKEDFFSNYATARSLNRTSGKSSLPPTTSLLRKGNRRYAEQVMNGTLPGGAAGALALYTYEVETRDSDGNTDTDYYRFTVVMHDIPAVAVKVADINCQRRSGFRFMDSAEDAFRKMQRLELESEVLDKRYEIFYGAQDDQIWMKRLFSPSFIVWLTERVPDGFAWELSAGSLCVYRRGHYETATELDTFCVAAGQVATRLVTEAGQ